MHIEDDPLDDKLLNPDGKPIEEPEEEDEINEGDFIGVLDRSFVISDSIQNYLLDHRISDELPSVRKKFEEAQALILDAYQEIGAVMFEKYPK